MATTEMTRSGGSSSASQGMSDELSHDAGRLKETAKERAKQEVETRKGQATQAARSTSSALDKAAEELQKDENAPGWLTSAFKQTASQIDRFASSVENRSPEQIGQDVNRLARQNPTAFLAASAAVGFAAARFLRAGAEYQHDHPNGSGQSGVSAYTGNGPGYAESGTYPAAGENRYAGAEGGTVL